MNMLRIRFHLFMPTRMAKLEFNVTSNDRRGLYRVFNMINKLHVTCLKCND